jgi:hypothetical protein
MWVAAFKENFEAGDRVRLTAFYNSPIRFLKMKLNNLVSLTTELVGAYSNEARPGIGA